MNAPQDSFFLYFHALGNVDDLQAVGSNNNVGNLADDPNQCQVIYWSSDRKMEEQTIGLFCISR